MNINRKRIQIKAQKLLNKIYERPIISAFFISLITGIYLFYDIGVINASSLEFFWNIESLNGFYSEIYSDHGFFALCIALLSKVTGFSLETSGQVIMLFSHGFIAVFLLLIAKDLKFSNLSCWVLIFLLLAHSSYNNFRSYIISEPIYWLLWLSAIYVLIKYYKKNLPLVLAVWVFNLLIATQVNIVAWFWLLLFPIGLLFWPKWQRKSVVYALLIYLVLVTIALFIPIYDGISAYETFVDSFWENSSSFAEMLNLKSSDWVQDDEFMSTIFIFSGAFSLVLVRSVVAFGLIGTFLAIYAFVKKQTNIIMTSKFQFLLYLLIFDILSTVILFIFSINKNSTVYFTSTFILLLFACLGLSYILKKIQFNKYTKLTSLVIVWILVGYFASGLISFGPNKSYQKKAGVYLKSNKEKQTKLISNSRYVLFYSQNNPENQVDVEQIKKRIIRANLIKEKLVLAFRLNRKRTIPVFLENKKIALEFQNKRGDKVLIYYFDRVNAK